MTDLTTHKIPVFSLNTVRSEPYRVMVVGENVMTVQAISRFCLNRQLEVLPYYGIPTDEDVTLFDPKVCILCWPTLHAAEMDHRRPYWVWAEAGDADLPTDIPQVSSFEQLSQLLQELSALN